MDFELIAGIVIILLVATAVVMIARRYQTVREETGYHQGKFYRLRQHIGAYMGNYQMNRLGMDNETAEGRTESDELMFYYSENDQDK